MLKVEIFVQEQCGLCFFRDAQFNGTKRLFVVFGKRKDICKTVAHTGIQVVGGTDIIIFAFGEDLDGWKGYAADNEKFLYLKQKGFDYYCNVDASSEHWIQIGANKDYFRQARRNLDGTRMWEAVMSYTDSSYHNRLSDLFDARDIFDPARPTPVE